MEKTEIIVIRCKTLLRSEDFKRWAQIVKTVNPGVVVIPCDAEIVKAKE